MKISMAVAGLLFVFYVLMHMYGNLKLFAGQAAFDGYAHHLRVLGEPILPYSGFLWIFRTLLLLALVVHVASAIATWKAANHARTTKYVVKRAAAASFSSKMMRWGGVALLAFLVWHLLQFTILKFNVGDDDINTHSPYQLVVSSFQEWWVVLIYLVAVFALAMHLHHGVWSAGQTLGLTNTASQRRMWKLAGLVIAAVVGIGFILPPLAVLFGIIKF